LRGVYRNGDDALVRAEVFGFLDTQKGGCIALKVDISGNTDLYSLANFFIYMTRRKVL
jgi:hypothetical protein